MTISNKSMIFTAMLPVTLYWKVLAPIAFLQVIVNLVLKGIFFS